MKRGQYLCPKCGAKFAWCYGFTEKAPKVEDKDRANAICPPCSGLQFKSPIEILTGKPVQ
jgi:hypothetical protein